MSFTRAAHICKIFLRSFSEEDRIDITDLLRKELVSIRRDGKYPRLQTAHFRKPKYFIYRVV